MICPKCGANVSDESRFCNMCQEPLTEDAKAETANAAAAMQPKQKNKNLPIYLAIVAVVVVIAVMAAVLGSRNNDNNVVPSEEAVASSEQVSNETGTDAIGTYTEAQLDGAIARVESEGYTMNNVEFNYYYWGQYYYVVAAYGQNLSSFFDVTKPLDGQMYNDTMTWQDFFIENAISAFIQTKALVFDAAKAGFEMPEETRAALEQTLLELQTYAEEYKDEYADIDAYIAASYGEGATFETFSTYLEESYLSSAYTEKLYADLSFTDAELEEYYDTYAADYEAAGMPKDDTHVVDARHILVAFETDEEGNVTEEANAAAKEEAQKLYDQWQADGGTEEAFAALATANTDDTATAASGGLCANIAPGDTVTAFNDWIFAEGRQAGDCELVETEFGWHVVYFVQEGGLLWKLAAESDLGYETMYGTIEQATERYFFEVDKSAMVINTPTDVSAGFVSEEAAAEEAPVQDTADQSAQEAAE